MFSNRQTRRPVLNFSFFSSSWAFHLWATNFIFCKLDNCFEAGGASLMTASWNLKTEQQHLMSLSFSLSLCILLCKCLQLTCSRLEMNNMKIHHLHLWWEDLLHFLNLNEPCFLCDKGAQLYTSMSGCGFTGPMPWSLSPPTSLNPLQHGSPPSLQWQGGCSSTVVLECALNQHLCQLLSGPMVWHTLVPWRFRSICILLRPLQLYCRGLVCIAAVSYIILALLHLHW